MTQDGTLSPSNSHSNDRRSLRARRYRTYAHALHERVRTERPGALLVDAARTVGRFVRDGGIRAVRRPIFVVGCPRSGTTFLGSCLGRIHNVAYFFEPTALMDACGFVAEGRWSIVDARRYYLRVFNGLLLAGLHYGKRFCEKSPREVFVLSFLAEAFPDGQVIHVIRDGRDVSVSLLERGWLNARASDTSVRPGGLGTAPDAAILTGRRYGAYPRHWVEAERREEFMTTSDLHRCIWCWRRHVEAGLEGMSSLGARRYLEVRYERLVMQPAESAKEILQFLEEEDGATKDDFERAVSQGHASSVGRYKTKLTEDDLRVMEGEAGPLLDRLGYSPGNSESSSRARKSGFPSGHESPATAPGGVHQQESRPITREEIQ